jgi:hypothetical protein
MSIEQLESGPTSNDLLESLIAGRASAALDDQAVSPDPIAAESALSASILTPPQP